MKGGATMLQSRWQVKAERSALKDHKGLDPSPGCSKTGNITCLPLPDT